MILFMDEKTKILMLKSFEKFAIRFGKNNIELLAKGWKPEKTKFGDDFKGKNRVVICQSKKN